MFYTSWTECENVSAFEHNVKYEAILHITASYQNTTMIAWRHYLCRTITVKVILNTCKRSTDHFQMNNEYISSIAQSDVHTTAWHS